MDVVLSTGARIEHVAGTIVMAEDLADVATMASPYAFIFCILCFLFYFSFLYSVVFVLYLGHGMTTTTDIIIAVITFIVTDMPNVILLILSEFNKNSVLNFILEWVLD